MKKLIVLLFAFIIGCNLQGDNNPLNLKAVWTPNPADQNVIQYCIYWWQGDDTTAFNVNDMVCSDSVAHLQVDSLMSLPLAVTFNYVRAGATALSENGVSPMALTRFYSYFEFAAPSSPENMRIKK